MVEVEVTARTQFLFTQAVSGGGELEPPSPPPRKNGGGLHTRFACTGPATPSPVYAHASCCSRQISLLTPLQGAKFAGEK